MDMNVTIHVSVPAIKNGIGYRPKIVQVVERRDRPTLLITTRNNRKLSSTRYLAGIIIKVLCRQAKEVWPKWHRFLTIQPLGYLQCKCQVLVHATVRSICITHFRKGQCLRD